MKIFAQVLTVAVTLVAANPAFAGWTNWLPCPSAPFAQPVSLVTYASNVQAEMRRNETGDLVVRYYQGGQPGEWKNFLGQKSQFEPTLVSWGANAIDVFWVNPNGSVGHSWWRGQGDFSVENLGGILVEAPFAYSIYQGHIRIVGRGNDGKLYCNEYVGN